MAKKVTKKTMTGKAMKKTKGGAAAIKFAGSAGASAIDVKAEGPLEVKDRFLKY